MLEKIRNKGLKIVCIIILSIGFYSRTFNLNWDSGHYFHPDERAIIMFVTPLHLPSSFAEFLTPKSPLNTHFFAYGNFPLYLLKITAQLLEIILPNITQYGFIHIVGRYISALFDTATIGIVFLLAKRLRDIQTGLISAFFYSVFVFPIQASHYFAVDTILTFFLTTTLLSLISFYSSPSYKKAILLGTLFGLSLATKISALIFLPVIIISFLLIIINTFTRTRSRFLAIIYYIFWASIVTVLVFVITQPYALIDFQEFIKQTTLQSQMSKDPFVFPYTLQFVGKIPYLYEIKNIVLYGIGIPLSICSLLGILLLTYQFVRIKKYRTFALGIVLLFFWLYFATFGSFAVGWMRYMLPIYPIFRAYQHRKVGVC